MELLSAQAAGWIVIPFLIVCLALGVHIGVALGLAGFVGILLTVGPDAAGAQFAAVPFSTTNNFNLAVIPLFILMGSFATAAGIVSECFRTAYVWLGKLRGGLAMATVMSSAAFGAASGSTIVNAPVFTNMVMSGVITEQSIGKLLIAGIIPGIVTALIYCGGICVLARVRPDLAPLADIKIGWSERWRSLYGVSGIAVLFFLVVGGIYGGYFPATYAGAVGAFGAFLIALVKRKLGFGTLTEV